jgi:hypothetical protein
VLHLSLNRPTEPAPCGTPGGEEKGERIFFIFSAVTP